MEKPLTKDSLLGKLFWLSLLVILAEIATCFLKKSSLPAAIPLYYSRPWGANQLAPQIFIFLIPAISLAFLLLNLAFSLTFLKKNERFLARTGAAFSLSFSLLGLITLLKIISIIT